jgi:hypothetical protein
VTAPAGNPGLDDLVGRLRDLTAAAAGSIAPERLAQTTDALMAALVELRELRAGARDPRRAKSLALARRVLDARRAGASVAQCIERFGKSRAQIYKLARVSRLDETVSRSNGATETKGA